MFPQKSTSHDILLQIQEYHSHDTRFLPLCRRQRNELLTCYIKRLLGLKICVCMCTYKGKDERKGNREVKGKGDRDLSSQEVYWVKGSS